MIWSSSYRKIIFKFFLSGMFFLEFFYKDRVFLRPYRRHCILTWFFSDLIFQLLIRQYLLELDVKTKIIEKTRIIRTFAEHLCDFENDKTEEIEKFSEFLSHPNILFDLTNSIRDILEKSNDRNEILSKNVIFYLECITQVFPNEEMDQ